MAMVELTSEPNIKASKAISFPPYMNSADESFELLKIADPNRTINPFIPNTRKHTQHKAEDEEIDVFTAEKYFNEEVEEEYQRNEVKGTPNYHHKKDCWRDESDDPPEVVVVDPVKPKIRPRTPSIRSESSWNSRSILLQKIPRTHQPNTNSIKLRGKNLLARISCNSSCIDKNSIDIALKSGELSFNSSPNRAKKPPITSKGNMQIKNSNFPILYPKVKLQHEELDVNRKSIEVFGSPVSGRRKSFNLDPRLKMVAWDAIAPRTENENPLNSNDINYETGSEASSDLFEIESFPSNSNLFPSTTTRTSCYAPSEASIEWSVVTASAADYFSVASDSDEPKMPSSTTQNTFIRSVKNGREFITKGKPKRIPSILLGCKSQKAVGVAGDAHRKTSERAIPGARKHHNSEDFTPLTRFHTENKIAGFGVRNSGSFSNREAHVLYI